MKKKVLALVLAASMAASMATSVSVFAEAATATVADLPAEAQFEPNADYDEYTTPSKISRQILYAQFPQTKITQNFILSATSTAMTR